MNIQELSDKIDQQDQMIQQLLDITRENKLTIKSLRSEASENQKTIASLLETVELLNKKSSPSIVAECKESVEALDGRIQELEKESGRFNEEKDELDKKLDILDEQNQKILTQTLEESATIMAETNKMTSVVEKQDERIQKLLDESGSHADTHNKMANMELAQDEFKQEIQKLNQEVSHLKTAKIHTESVLVMKDKVHELLAKRITHLEQYTRRYSVVVKGIDFTDNEKRNGKLKEEVMNLIQDSNCTTTFEDVDKYHRNGPRFEKKQDILIRFKSHSAKESFYRARKSIKRTGIKIQPSLSSETYTLLDDAKTMIGSYEHYEDLRNPPDFVMADLHGNLWVKFKEETKDNQLFYRFDSLERLRETIEKYNTDDKVMEGRNMDYGRFD